MAKLISVKITDTSRDDLKLIAAKKRETLYQTVQRLAEQEKRKLRLT